MGILPVVSIIRNVSIIGIIPIIRIIPNVSVRGVISVAQNVPVARKIRGLQRIPVRQRATVSQIFQGISILMDLRLGAVAHTAQLIPAAQTIRQ